MNRVAIAERLKNLASIFKPNTPFCRDLKAMAYVLNNMSDDKFKNIVADNFKDFIDYEEEEKEEEEEGKNKSYYCDYEDNSYIEEDDEEDAPYTYWNREASNLVKENLLREVVGMDKPVCCDTGRKLTKEQIPEGIHKGLPKKPDSLKEKQTPDVSKKIKSNMLEKSKKEIKKTASIKNNGYIVEGVELLPSMDSIELTSKDIAELGLLFE